MHYIHSVQIGICYILKCFKRSLFCSARLHLFEQYFFFKCTILNIGFVYEHSNVKLIAVMQR